MSDRLAGTTRLTAKQQAVLALKLQETRPAGPPIHEPIAIIGLGCRFPGGADSPAAFWRLLRSGIDAVDEVPPDRWPVDDYFDADPAAPGKMYSRWGAFLPDVDKFDARFFGLAPREVANMDPQQRLLLEVSWEALESAGIVPGDLERTPTGVFMGISTADYARLAAEDPGRIDAYYGTGNSFSVAAGRIAFLLGAQGPVFALDTACSSSLVALHQAVQSLRARECNLALVGGVNLILIPETTIFFAKLQALSPDGRCKAFDASANGYVRGEGAGAVVLKRLSAALRDGDPIVAVIRGTAINHDGPSSGLTVPNGPAQQAVIRQALRDGNVDPAQIGYIEAHGTGTALGDPIEMHALAAVFGSGEREADQPLYVGSVKSNLGHLEAAAGIAGLLKVVLALQHRQLPPHLHFREPSPRIEWDRLGSIRVLTALIDWAAPAGPRLAGVSSFGFSGTNAHVVVEEAPAAAPSKAVAPPAVLLPLSAKSERALRTLAGRYAGHLAELPDQSLADAAFTASRRRPHYDQRLAVVGGSIGEVAERLAAFAAGESSTGLAAGAKPPVPPNKLVFIFPGQGPEWAGMGQQLYAQSALYREVIEACHAIVTEVAGWSLRDFFAQPESAPPLLGVDKIHPVLFAAQVGLARLWQSWGLQPAAVVGQSLGEITALHVAGSLRLREALTLMIVRSQLIHRLHGTGRMVMVGLSEADARRAISASGERLYVAVERGPDSVVVAGRPEAVDRWVARLQAEGVFCRVVVNDVATHCPVADPIVAELGQRASGLQTGASDVTFYSTVTAARHAPQTVGAAYWQRNLIEPVRWYPTLQNLLADGFQVLVEVSPHPTLLTTIEQAAQAAGRTVVAVGSTERRKDEWAALMGSVGRLYAAGIAPDWAQLYPTGAVWPLPTYAWDRERYWVEATAGSETARARTLPNDLTGPVALRGQRVPSPLAALQFAAAFEEKALPYLRDHRVGETVVVAGAAHVSQLIEAAAEPLGAQPVSVRNVSFLEPLFVPEGERQSVQVVLEPLAPGRFSAQVFGRPEQGGEADRWARHVTAEVEAATLDQTVTDLSGTVAAAEALPLEAYHAALDAQPYRLTGSFRRLETLWRTGDGALVAMLRPPASADEAADYRLHPGLLDLCFQAIGAAAFFDPAGPRLAAGEIFVPVAIEAVHWQRAATAARWCRAVVRPATGSDVTVGDVQLFDAAGQLLARVVGFQARRFAAADFIGSRGQQLARWLYEVQWQRQPLTVPSLPTRGQWLILADGQGVAGGIAAELRRRGGFPILVTPEALSVGRPNGHAPNPRGAIRRLLSEAAATHTDLRGVINCWGSEPPTSDAALPTTAGQQALNALYLAQALAELPRPPRLVLVTQQAALTADQAARPWQSALWGLGRVIANELPELRCALVDVDGPAAATAVVDELLAGSDENQVALHDGRRLVARLGLSGSARQAGSVSIRADGAYVITGGFGGLGLAVAGWLVEQGARSLLLIGRREPSPEAQVLIDRLRADGAEVVTALADVAERDQLAGALRAADHMPPLAGVVHAAGTLEDALIASLEAERFERVLRVKVDGAWHLHTLTLDRPLDFFVLFSSIAAVFGSPGQANHAAASAFLDGLAHYRRGLGLPGLSLNWGPWAGVGAATGRASTERVIAGGMAPIEPEWGLSLLAQTLSAPQPQLIAMSVDWGRWFSAFPGSASAPLLAELARQQASIAPIGPAAASVTRQLAALARPEERRDLLHGFLTRQIAQVLRLPPAQIGPDTPFASLGFDSLMTLEVKNSLEKQLGLVLPVSLVWNYPTVAELAGYLAGELGLSLEADAEVRSEAAEANGSASALDDLSEAELLDLLDEKLDRLKKAL